MAKLSNRLLIFLAMSFLSFIKAKLFGTTESPNKQYSFDFNKVSSNLFAACQNEENFAPCETLSNLVGKIKLEDGFASNIPESFTTIAKNTGTSLPTITAMMFKFENIVRSIPNMKRDALVGEDGNYPNFITIKELREACKDKKNVSPCDKLDGLFYLMNSNIIGVKVILENPGEVIMDIEEALEEIGAKQNWSKMKISKLETQVTVELLDSLFSLI